MKKLMIGALAGLVAQPLLWCTPDIKEPGEPLRYKVPAFGSYIHTVSRRTSGFLEHNKQQQERLIDAIISDEKKEVVQILTYLLPFKLF
jgi:hypothetical protein